jgi:hypothetical protein
MQPVLARLFARQAALHMGADGLSWLMGAGQTDTHLPDRLNLPAIYQAQSERVADMDCISDSLNRTFAS